MYRIYAKRLSPSENIIESRLTHPVVYAALESGINGLPVPVLDNYDSYCISMT